MKESSTDGREILFDTAKNREVLVTKNSHQSLLGSSSHHPIKVHALSKAISQITSSLSCDRKRRVSEFAHFIPSLSWQQLPSCEWIIVIQILMCHYVWLDYREKYAWVPIWRTTTDKRVWGEQSFTNRLSWRAESKGWKRDDGAMRNMLIFIRWYTHLYRSLSCEDAVKGCVWLEHVLPIIIPRIQVRFHSIRNASSALLWEIHNL